MIGMSRWVRCWWCAVCRQLRAPIRYPQIGAMCPVCRSGRVSPTLPLGQPITLIPKTVETIRPGEKLQLPTITYTID